MNDKFDNISDLYGSLLEDFVWIQIMTCNMYEDLYRNYNPIMSTFHDEHFKHFDSSRNLMLKVRRGLEV